jgi:hypothetical protein
LLRPPRNDRRPDLSANIVSVVRLWHLAPCRAESSFVPSNRVLSRLSRSDFRLLQPHLEAVDLPLRKQLAARNKRVQQVYFPESGFASVVADGTRAIEVGIIGREGMTGLSIVMQADDRSPHETYMQLAGHGQRVAADKLRSAIDASRTLHRVMLHAAQLSCFRRRSLSWPTDAARLRNAWRDGC